MRYLRKRLRELLLEGVTPEAIALSLSAGVVLGVFPALGWTTLLCAGAAWTFRLNLPAIQLVNYVTYPLQLALLIPFIRSGEWLFGVPHMAVSVESIMSMIQSNVAQAIAALWWTTMRAIVAWLLVGPVTGLAIYSASLPFLRRMAGRTT
ncbi:MAG: DUF2062 domain-containing protein [Acidobacteriota bacterium]